MIVRPVSRLVFRMIRPAWTPAAARPVPRFVVLAIAPLVLAALMHVVAGCATSRQSPEDMPRDIRWLTVSLQHKGIMVRERGNAFLSTTASSNVRLIVDSRETLDVFEFQSPRAARQEGYRIAGLYPQNDVFVVEALVVLRYTTRATGLTATLVEILGTPI